MTAEWKRYTKENITNTVIRPVLCVKSTLKNNQRREFQAGKY